MMTDGEWTTGWVQFMFWVEKFIFDPALSLSFRGFRRHDLRKEHKTLKSEESAKSMMKRLSIVPVSRTQNTNSIV